MQYGDHLEQLVLSGELFTGASRSSSPARTPSPSTSWPELSDDEDARAPVPAPADDAAPPIGMGPGRTGVKGVIRDRDEAAARTRERRTQETAALARAMEKASLGGKTYLEEERERQWEAGLGMVSPPAFFGGERAGRFGHLREVGMKGYVNAVEEEDRRVWVVVHIYDPSLDRCDQLDDTLCRLARQHPETKFIRCRASAIGFATSSEKRTGARRPSSSYLSRSRTVPGRRTNDDEEDPYGDDEKGLHDEEDEDEDEDEDNVDTDMLPTMLVYRAGDLVHNWVRVDWEAGDAGVEDLLERHNVVEPIRMGSSNLGLPLDEEDIGLSGSENGL
ncbi:hypothetical protein DENSPDRAFT_694322 [Dentipellis sp. KUC8613]|nr:hypothetical protein DENSPDRAFT_694322 [Dentipellis sp. KUC8613]